MNDLETVVTADEIRALSSSNSKAVLLDSGGFVWWTYTNDEGYWMAGAVSPARAGTHGTAIQAWMNLMTPEQAAAYGPFTIIHRGGK